MSALGGFWNFNGRPDAHMSCQRMLAAQKIYGPHHGCTWDGGNIALGRRLFRILPEDVHDRDVQSDAGGRYRLVADVRLDNRDELIAALGMERAKAAALPDAAFLLGAWLKWEESCFDRLLGDYAFALWDGHKHRLVLARDPIANHPLHYHRGNGFFAFASMPKGLHALPEVPYAPDEVRVAELLALLPESGPASFFRGVSRVEGGHFLNVTSTGTETRRHWNPSRRSMAPWRGGDAAEQLREHLDRAVTARLRGASDCVGSHLSGGFDSGAVASTAARLMARRGGRVMAFTSVPREGYDGPDPPGRFGDEGPLAAKTAALYSNMEHVLVRSNAGTILDGIDRDFFLFDRPLTNACNHRWMSDINAEAQRRGVNVILTATLGNMTISYAGTEFLAELAANRRWVRLYRESHALVRAGAMRWGGAFATAFGPWIPPAAWRAIDRLRNGMGADLKSYSALNPQRGRALEISKTARGRGFDFSCRPNKDGFESRLWVMRRVDFGNFNKGWLAGWGTSLRDPTSDRRLFEFCLSLPMEAFISKGIPRALAKRAFAGQIADAVLSEPRSGLQGIDWHEGLAVGGAGLSEEIARLERIPVAADALDLSRMRALVDDWPTGDWTDARTERLYRRVLLRGLTCGHFLRSASRSNS